MTLKEIHVAARALIFNPFLLALGVHPQVTDTAILDDTLLLLMPGARHLLLR